MFPELFNQLENHSEIGNAENENQVENKQLALPAPAEDERLVPDRDLVQLPPPPDWSVREDPLQVKRNVKLKRNFLNYFRLIQLLVLRQLNHFQILTQAGAKTG